MIEPVTMNASVFYVELSLFAVIAGPFVGSFLATAAIRVTRHQPIVFGRSLCPTCNSPLAAMSLIPVLSWLVQRARCRACSGRISSYYPAIEIAATGIALWSFATVSGGIAITTCFLGWALLTLSIIDFRERLLPDVITLPLALSGICATAYFNPGQLTPHLVTGLAGAFTAAAIAWLYARLRGRTGLGGGDIKLIGAAGIWVGPAGLPGVILIASVSALMFASATLFRGARPVGSVQIPFGPFLAIGLWLTWIYGPLLLAPGAP